MQTLWWLHNQIPRHTHKKRSSAFPSRSPRIRSQNPKKAPIWPIKKSFRKIRKMHQKTQNPTPIPNPPKKSRKNVPKKKLPAKTWWKIALFFTFTHVRQTCFAYNSLPAHPPTTPPTDPKPARNSALPDTSLDLPEKKNLSHHISTSSKPRSQTRKKRLKNQKTYLVNVSQTSIPHSSEGLHSLFSKKSNSLYPNAYFQSPPSWVQTFWRICNYNRQILNILLGISLAREISPINLKL